LIEQPAEPGLAVRGAVARKARQREPNATLQPLRENRVRQNGAGSQISTLCPDNPRIVIASRAEVLFPSETSTRSGLGTSVDAAMPAGGFVSRFDDEGL
jgi:hypothetical protein